MHKFKLVVFVRKEDLFVYVMPGLCSYTKEQA